MKKFKKIFSDIITFRWLFVGAVLFYKKCLSPLLPKVCIYYPTCSEYMLESIGQYGVIRGIFRGTKRLLRCVPWAKGGSDPVPLNPKGVMRWVY